MTENVEVRFRLFAGAEPEKDEGVLLNDPAQRKTTYRANPDHDGAIVIRSEGNQDLMLEDELPALVKNVCFGAIGELRSKPSVVVSYYSWSGSLHLDSIGPNVRVSGDGLTEVIVCRARLLTSLYGCGMRFIQYLEKIKIESGDEKAVALIHFLGPYGETAKRSLVDWASVST